MARPKRRPAASEMPNFHFDWALLLTFSLRQIRHALGSEIHDTAYYDVADSGIFKQKVAKGRAGELLESLARRAGTGGTGLPY